MKQSYNVKEVETTASEIDSKIDLLLVVHPKKISEQTEYAIDQYIMKGGKAVILVDGQCEYDARNQRNPSPQARFQESFESNLPKLLPALGIEVAPGKVLTDINCAAKVNVGGGLPQDYIAYLMFKKDNCNQAELMSANLESLLIGVPGVLKKKADAKYTITPLIESSDQAMEMDGFRIKMMTMTPNPDLEALKRDYTPGNQKLGFAYKITGKFETAFPGGKPESLLPKEPNQKKDEEKEKKGDEAKAVHLAAAEKEGTVVVIGDVDFITDDFAVDVRNFFGQKMITARGDNLNFINNVIEIMTGSEDLINLRTRGKSVRPFTTVEAIERRAQEKFKGEEDQLQKKLDETNQKISELQRGKNDPGQHAILSPEQVKELDEFRKEVAETKKHLRGVRLNLRKDIESLGARLKFMNIALMPILITLFSFVPSAWRTHRMRTNRRD
ncbi:Gldg family protein [Candidatus Sumerlaeota bacterium]|nr:Gldg family protein [Candidatus Sumerlaeota bacterium]